MLRNERTESKSRQENGFWSGKNGCTLHLLYVNEAGQRISWDHKSQPTRPEQLVHGGGCNVCETPFRDTRISRPRNFCKFQLFLDMRTLLPQITSLTLILRQRTAWTLWSRFRHHNRTDDNDIRQTFAPARLTKECQDRRSSIFVDHSLTEHRVRQVLMSRTTERVLFAHSCDGTHARSNFVPQFIVIQTTSCLGS